jgi:Family of unknown function (DUF5990)
MKTDLPVTLRLRVVQPPAGVRWAVQLGRDGLLPPIQTAPEQLVFEVPLTLGPNVRGVLQLRGAAIQGPPAARFVYVNSGKRAAESSSCWDRRAKVSLATIDIVALQNVVGHAILEGAMNGTARDGGPACASVTLIDGAWKLSATERTGQSR